jgi:hypothetical protein
MSDPNPRPPDHPAVPRGRARHGFGAWLAIIFTIAIVAGYAWVGYTQYQLDPPEKDEVPASVRASPGGYRSFHFWHSGYHGGK